MEVTRFNKALLSCLLVLTYSIGFTHNLVPHCSGEVEHVDVSTESVHHHDHHEHNQNDASDHEHIVHKNHLDLNYLDLVLCLLEDVEQDASHCGQEHCFVLYSKILSLKDLPSTQLTYILCSFIQSTDVIDLQSQYDLGICYCYQSPPIEKSPHRGPPFTTLS